MLMYIIILAIVVSVIGIIYQFVGITSKFRHNMPQKIDVNHVNENSFQRFAKFYGETYPHEEKFDAKLNQIYMLIQKNGERDIKKIAEAAFCGIPECVIKIKYLKNFYFLSNMFNSYVVSLL